MGFKRYKKDPNATLDYVFDFAAKTNGSDTSPEAADYLLDGELVVDCEIEADSGIVVEPETGIDVTGTKVVVWLSGGTVGESYTVTCRITTNNVPPRVDDHSITIKIAEK